MFQTLCHDRVLIQLCPFLQILTRRLRFRLERAPGETALIDRTGRMLKMEPLATVESLEQYLLKMVRLLNFNGHVVFPRNTSDAPRLPRVSRRWRSSGTTSTARPSSSSGSCARAKVSSSGTSTTSTRTASCTGSAPTQSESGSRFFQVHIRRSRRAAC